MNEAAAPAGHDLWDGALSAARAGDTTRAREICAELRDRPPAFPGEHELLLGRCLAEAGADLQEAVSLLRRARELNPRNVMAPHALALAHLRAGEHREASEIFQSDRLPHDTILLAEVALAMEMAARPWPERLPEGWPPISGPLEPVVESDPLSAPDREPALVSAPAYVAPQVKKLNREENRRYARLLNRLEAHYHEHRPLDLILEAGCAMVEGLDGDDLHLLAGLASEEAGDEARARMHLSRTIELEPRQLIARVALGRVYWRSGWNDLAEDIWRSLPVEGPDDYGRHYHLALAFEASGRRAEALQSLGAALGGFFLETREFYIEQAHRRWRCLLAV